MSWNEIHNIIICQPHLLSLREKQKNSKNFLQFITWISSRTYCLKHHHALKRQCSLYSNLISTDQTQLELHHNTNNLWARKLTACDSTICLNIKDQCEDQLNILGKNLLLSGQIIKETHLAFKVPSLCHMVPSSHDFLQEEPTISIKWWTAWYTKFSAAPMAIGSRAGDHRLLACYCLIAVKLISVNWWWDLVTAHLPQQKKDEHFPKKKKSLDRHDWLKATCIEQHKEDKQGTRVGRKLNL